MDSNELMKLGRIYILLRNTLISVVVVVFLGVGYTAWKAEQPAFYDSPIQKPSVWANSSKTTPETSSATTVAVR